MTIKKHTHKLMRYKYKTGNEVFFCILDCTFKIDTAFAIGKKCICHRCNKEFELTEMSVRLKRPHCNSCGKIKVVDPETGKKKYIMPTPAAIAEYNTTANEVVNELKASLGAVIREPVEEDLL